MAVEEQLAVALRLADVSRAAVTRSIPARPGVDAAEVIHRVGAAANELGRFQAGLSPDLRFHVAYPVMVPHHPGHISELLATRSSTAMQLEDAEAELLAARCGVVAPEATLAYVTEFARLRQRFADASSLAENRMRRITSRARDAIVTASSGAQHR